MNKILVIGLGGTIGSIAKGSIKLDSNCLKILSHCKYNDVEFHSDSPFSIFSENMNKELWQKLISYIEKIDFSKYNGIIILHGSDTLAYTSSIIANAFPKESIVIAASNKPIEDESSNGIANFNDAVNHILNGATGVYVSYDGIKKANCITSADINDSFREIDSTIEPASKKKISNKNVLIIKNYVGINFNNYDLKSVDKVLIEMFHSATVPDSAKEWAKSLRIPYHFVTHKKKAEYETAQDIENILYSCTIENAYALSILE